MVVVHSRHLKNYNNMSHNTKIYCLIPEFPGTKKIDRSPDIYIKSCTQPRKFQKEILRKRLNLKGFLVFCTYHIPNGLGASSLPESYI